MAGQIAQQVPNISHWLVNGNIEQFQVRHPDASIPSADYLAEAIMESLQVETKNEMAS